MYDGVEVSRQGANRQGCGKVCLYGVDTGREGGGVAAQTEDGVALGGEE